MAIEDYFKGSSQAYGQLAGSLLAGRRKEDKKEKRRRLGALVIFKPQQGEIMSKKTHESCKHFGYNQCKEIENEIIIQAMSVYVSSFFLDDEDKVNELCEKCDSFTSTDYLEL